MSRPPPGLRMCQLNCGGRLATRGAGDWLASVVVALNRPGPQDIILFTESHLSAGQEPPVLAGYRSWLCSRPGARQRGGLVLYVRTCLASQARQLTCDWRHGLLAIHLASVDLVVACCYFAPHSSPLYARGVLHPGPIEHLCSWTRAVQQTHRHVFLWGDFNAHVGSEWEFQHGLANDEPLPLHWAGPLCRRSSCCTQAVSESGKALLAALADCDLALLNGRAPGDEAGRCTCFGTYSGPRGASLPGRSETGGSTIDLVAVPAMMFAHVESCTVGLPILLEHQAKPMQHAPVWVVLDAAVGHMTSPTMLPTHISRTPRARPLRPTQEDMPAYAAKLMASPSVAVLHSLREQLAAGQSQAAAEVLS